MIFIVWPDKELKHIQDVKKVNKGIISVLKEQNIIETKAYVIETGRYVKNR